MNDQTDPTAATKICHTESDDARDRLVTHHLTPLTNTLHSTHKKKITETFVYNDMFNIYKILFFVFSRTVHSSVLAMYLSLKIVHLSRRTRTRALYFLLVFLNVLSSPGSVLGPP